MLATILGLTFPALLLPTAPRTPHSAVTTCSSLRVAPGWMRMQEEQAAAGEPAGMDAAGEGAEEEVKADDPKADLSAEKKELRDRISALEKELVGARGKLIEKQDAIK